MAGRGGGKRALLIAGPTASGKSRIAIELAGRFNGVVINADAMQVYRELQVLSARPGPEDLNRAHHELYGFVSAAERYSAGRWLEDASRALEDVWSSGGLPIVTGGTGLYFKALAGGLADIPAVSPEVRARVATWSAEEDLDVLSRRLETATGERLADRQRLVRALEVHEQTGRSLNDWQTAKGLNPLDGVAVVKSYLLPERSDLYARCEGRLDRMVEDGALDEVRDLLALTLDSELPAMKAIGVREFGAHLAGECSLEEALTAARTQTWRYAKRQLTWYRGQMQDWPALSPEDALPALQEQLERLIAAG
ncbi:MAG: tRNA (adenosine(37)-N6)-dimethylallyltransferase MiaA [Pseudomonadota bacterium]